MDRNSITTLDKLVDGDRFYKVGDKKKKALVVWAAKSKNRSTVTDSVIICPSEDFSTGHNPQIIKNPTAYGVVFLRHEIDIA